MARADCRLVSRRWLRAGRDRQAGVWPLAIAATATLTTLAGLTGCASLDPTRVAPDPPQAMQAGASAAPRTDFDFAAGLRCMDNLLLDHGVRELSMIVEDLVDPAQRVGAGSKDTLVAALSDMTQRSRSIRLVASGKDWGQTRNHMSQALQRETPAALPQYALRGSIGRPANAHPPSHAGSAGRPALLTLDLTLLQTQDMSVVPGTTSRNAASLSKPGAGGEGRAEIRKFGAAFGVSAGAGEGEAPAVRALARLAAMELLGRLARVPYWTCLGASAADAAVADEIQDWYDAMAARPAEIVGYFQRQLGARRVYDGPVDGIVNAQLKDAVARYREALGLAREPKLSLEFFKAYLGADHLALAARLAPLAVAAAAAPASATPLTLRIGAGGEGRRFGRGEAVQLTIRPNREAHVYCFLQDENRRIARFFPNRFQRDARVQPGAGLQLPGAMRFEISMNSRGVVETVTCFATERDVLAQLPAGVNATDFEPLPAATLEQLRSAFVTVAAGALAQDSFQIRPK